MFEKNAKITVAVSGGPDSMALLHLLSSITKNIIALTVDHGLRDESAAEAAQVATWCKKQKIEHHILKWCGRKPKTALHETARTARYELLQNWCRENNILHLATAHHADDNAETILQRIAKASGPQGLSGISQHVFLPHLHVWRPLLAHPKSDLVQYCEIHRIPFVNDPSNQNANYARGRLRGATDILTAEGLTTNNLNLLAQKQRMVVEALEDSAAKFLAHHVDMKPGTMMIAQDAWQAASAAVQQIVMDYVLKRISGIDSPIRYESLQNLCAAAAQDDFRPKTLGHCRIMHKKFRKTVQILIKPEAA